MTELGGTTDHSFRSSGGSNYGVVNIACASSSSKYPVVIPSMSKTVMLQGRGAVDFKLFRTESDTVYFTVKAGSTIAVDLATIDGDVTVAYVQFGTNTQVVEAFYLK